MWLAHFFPGVFDVVEGLEDRTPEETRALIDAGNTVLKPERDERFSYAQAIVAASGMRLR